MAYDAEKIAALTDQELTSLTANVGRLAISGTKIQMEEAARLTPLLEHERATRKANKPPPATKRGGARKPKEKPEA